jgi:hypothetical protein
MPAIEELEKMLSGINRYTWTYSGGPEYCNKLSCLAYSVEEARERVLAYVVNIENHPAQKKCEETYEKVNVAVENGCKDYRHLLEEGRKHEVEINQSVSLYVDIESFGWGFYRFGRDTDVTYTVGDDCISCSLEKMIMTVEPSVKKLNLMCMSHHPQ